MLLFVRPGAGAVDDVLDAENKRLAENLATKVSRLKSVSDREHSAGDQLIPAQARIINALTLLNPVMLKMTFVFVSERVSWRTRSTERPRIRTTTWTAW